MSSHIQNIDARLRAKGEELVAKAEKAAESVSSQFQTSGKISVGGIASAVEGSLSDNKFADTAFHPINSG